MRERAKRVWLGLGKATRRAVLWLVTVTRDALFFAGLATVAVGIGLIYFPAGVIALGLALAASVWLDTKTRGRRRL